MTRNTIRQSKWTFTTSGRAIEDTIMKKPARRIRDGAAVALVPLTVLGVLLATSHLGGRSDGGLRRAAVAQPAATSDPTLAVKDVFVRAVTLLQTVGIPPNASVDRVPTADDLTQMKNSGTAALNSLFTSNAVNEGLVRLNNAAQIAASDVRALGGGVSGVTYDTLVPSADGSYTISAHVTAWARLAQIHNGHAAVATPSNVLIVKATLIPANGTYMVDSYSWEYVPGSEP
jgi:hypothetical protein